LLDGWSEMASVVGSASSFQSSAKFSKVQPCAAAAGLRSPNLPRLLPPASANRAVTAFIHLSKEPKRMLAQPNNVGQPLLQRMSDLGWVAVIDAVGPKEDKLAPMSRYRYIFLFAVVAALFLGSVTIAIFRADKCSDQGGITVGFMTRSQGCIKQ